MESEYFCKQGLDNPNQVESPHEIGFCAHAFSQAFEPSKRSVMRKIELICPSRLGKNSAFCGVDVRFDT